MDKYLYKITLEFAWHCSIEKKDRGNIYLVASDSEDANNYAERHLKDGCSIKKVTCLGVQLGDWMFSGATKEKKKK